MIQVCAIITSVIFLLLPVLGLAQQDTAVLIEEVIVTGKTIRFEDTGSNSKSWNTLESRQTGADNVAELLERSSTVFIKSYGLGSLATSAIRGGSAGHTLVVWNGLPLQSPMLGLLDLALIPGQAAEHVRLIKGGNSSLWGSGAIGGALFLSNQPDNQEGIVAESTTEIGALGKFRQQLRFALGSGNVRGITKVSHVQARNDFKYSIGNNLPEQTNTNAELLTRNFQQDIYWDINKKNRLQFHLWNQFADREVPPTIAQNNSNAYQIDRANRGVLHWRNINKTTITEVKAGIFDESMRYHDPAIGLLAVNEFVSAIGELSRQQQIGKHKFQAGLTHIFTQAKSDNYAGQKTENKSSFFAAYEWRNEKRVLLASMRQELQDGKLVPLVPAIGIEQKLNNQVLLKLKLSRNYRLPTLNDRFWVPGGRVGLEAERGWSQELSVHLKQPLGKANLYGSITCFNRNIQDWILWTPASGQVFWAPENIAKVWSRGVESRLTLHKETMALMWKLEIGHDLIRSTNEVALENPKIDKGEQLIYTPRHRTFIAFHVKLGQFAGNYFQHLTGSVQGVNGSLTAYTIGDLKLQYTLKSTVPGGNIFFEMNNIWDKDYMVVERRAMPGRVMSGGLSIRLGK